MRSADLVDNAYIYNDLGSLNSLKVKARSDKDAGLREVAKQFESMFVSMMLKSMREANDVMFEDNMLNSYESKFYRQMYDDQLALHLSKDNSGTGLADVLYRQLKEQLPENRVNYLEPDHQVKSLSESNRPVIPQILVPDLDAIKLRYQQRQEQIDESKTSVDNQAPVAPSNTGSKVAEFDSPQDFVRQLLPHAANIGRATGLDPKALIAQAALETGWGQHVMKDDKGNSSFNLFGIKASHQWQGDVATVQTLEFDGDQFNPEIAQFRSYQSFAHSFKDYLNFLQTNPRYAQALRVGQDGDAFAEALQSAGYATDPEYASKIQRIASSPWLQDLIKQQAG